MNREHDSRTRVKTKNQDQESGTRIREQESALISKNGLGKTRESFLRRGRAGLQARVEMPKKYLGFSPSSSASNNSSEKRPEGFVPLTTLRVVVFESDESRRSRSVERSGRLRSKQPTASAVVKAKADLRICPFLFVIPSEARNLLFFKRPSVHRRETESNSTNPAAERRNDC
jgi:hypothetical protein